MAKTIGFDADNETIARVDALVDQLSRTAALGKRYTRSDVLRRVVAKGLDAVEAEMAAAVGQ